MMLSVRRCAPYLPHLLLSTILAAASVPCFSQGLSLKTERRYESVVSEATWMNPDISADGKTLLIDILGDIYTLPSSGGSAKPLLTGIAYESQPVFSPDGSKIAFISDRSGSNNLWIANADGSQLKQLSHNSDAMVFSSPAWMADGNTVMVSQMRYAMLAFHIHAYPTDGGEGYAITQAQPGGNEGFDDRHNNLGTVASPDGQYLYYSHKLGHTWSPHLMPHWSVIRRDLTTGEETPLVRAPGGAMNPALSHNGELLVYGTRMGEDTVLRLRNLKTGSEKTLMTGIDHDGHEGGYYKSLLPRLVFTPDDKSLITSVNGKLVRISIANGSATDIPFKAALSLPLGQQTRVAVADETGPVKVRIAQFPALSPDASQVAFSALGELYIKDLSDDRQPAKISAVGRGAFQPTWSPDGKNMAFVNWKASTAGHIWMKAPDGKPVRLTQFADYYAHPLFSADGKSIYALRSSHVERLNRVNELANDVAWDIIRIDLATRQLITITSAFGAVSLQQSEDGETLFYYDGVALQVVDLPSRQKAPLLRITGQHFSQYIDNPLPVTSVKIRPQGDWAIVKNASQLHLVSIPESNGETPTVNLSTPTVPHYKLTRIGADSVSWSSDGNTLYWTVGSEFHQINFASLQASGFSDAESAGKITSLSVTVPRDVPEGSILLSGATVLTMEKQDVLEQADILIEQNRIAAVGPVGSLDVPASTHIIDVNGKYITPGLVDAHAHWFDIQRGILDTDNQWNFLANLANGVTSGLDVQPFTVDVFSYQDMIDAGVMPGPRAFSTGPGIFVNSHIDSLDAARGVLTRYRDYYRTRNLKSYMVGPRERRQYMVEAAAELGMMPTTEGASDLRLNLTHALDGFSGNEHNLPVSPLHDDIVGLFAASQTSYTPTLTVLYGGKPGLSDFIAEHLPHTNAKVHRFLPPALINNKLRQANSWQPHDNQAYPRFADDAINIQRAGGVVAVGSHGEVQGFGYLWEMEALASGHGSPLEVLYAATMGSSRALGRDHLIGSITPGKYADLLILSADPRQNMANMRQLEKVIKNGRIYQADTLSEVWPNQKPAPVTWFNQQKK